MVNSQNLKVSGTLEEIFLKRTYQGEKWKVDMSTHYYMYLKPLNGGFIIPLISFSSLLASFFEKLYGLI